MKRPYSRELSADTSSIIIPAVTTVAFFICLGLVAFQFDFRESWYFWLVVVIFPISSLIAWYQIQQDHIEQANTLFITTGLILLALVTIHRWTPGSPLPYLFAIFIITTSMTVNPESSFIIWGVSSLFIVVGIWFIERPENLSYIYDLIWPILVNFFLALIAYLAAYEWRFAVESISDLHRKVRSRRNELFNIQEELRLNNSILRSLNEEIERARTIAIEEKEIRTQFMNTVSHELRTPLNSIVNFAHILSQGVRGAVTEGQVDYLTRIQHSGWHLLAVLNDLLDMAQIEAGEFDLKLEPINLHTVCEDAMNNTIGLQMDSGLSIMRDYPEQWPTVKADPMRLQQAIINLIGNAFKYTKEGYVCLRVTFDEEWVYIAVADSGMGIAEENLENIFKEFHQIDQNVARKRIGTGLGLPIAKHLIDRHDGKIEVESELGKGSTFTIRLPLFSGESAHLNGQATMENRLGGKT